MTNYEMELITALESGIRRGEVLALFFEEKVPEVEIQEGLVIICKFSLSTSSNSTGMCASHCST
jgi:hypothetical protein